jgi:hypothetical protein
MQTRRGSGTICLNFGSRERYDECVGDASLYRRYVETQHCEHPELFPAGMESGFCLHSSRTSLKLGVVTRRIQLKASGATFWIRPSLVLPYMVALTDDVEKALYLQHNGASFEALEYAFGRNHMFWYRVSAAVGRCSIVGTTVKSHAKMPGHLVADEKHTWIKRKKAYVATTVGGGCILGAEVSTSASTTALTKSYGVFADEARDVDPEYTPKTVCLDPWKPARKAWKDLFPAVFVVLCFLHSVLKLMKGRPTGVTRERLIGRSWHVYAASTKAQFSQRLRRLREWADAHLPVGSLLNAVHAMSSKCDPFMQAYDFDTAHRTTNHVDRLMDHQDRRLYAMHYFHGTLAAASLAARSGALCWNFHPYGRRARPQAEWTSSPFTELNGFSYHENWLHNLLIASSMGGWRRQSPTASS